MGVEVFLDTNILIYATHQDDPRSGIAGELLARGGVISVQVLNEFANAARRKLRLSWGEIRSALADIRALYPIVRAVGTDTHEAALGLAERDGFAFYDALIVAAAMKAGCTTLWTEDMQDGRTIDGLTIRNPFASA